MARAGEAQLQYKSRKQNTGRNKYYEQQFRSE